jgi:hypothetical protein
MHVDQPGGDPLAQRIDAGDTGIGLQLATDGGDAAVAQQHVGVVQAPAGTGQHRGVLDQYRRIRMGLVGAGVGIGDEARGAHRRSRAQ